MFPLLLWLIFGITVAVRAYLLFSISGVPEINGAYYLVQARSVLETGTLGIPDLPLTFYLHAGLARIAELCGMSQSDAILLMVKMADSVLPALVAVGFGYAVRNLLRYDDRTSSRMITAIALIAATTASLSLLPISMIGNYMKNSLGLVWMAFMFLTGINWIQDKNRKNTILFLTTLVLLGLTHIGVLGISLALLAFSSFFFIASGKFNWKTILKSGSIIIGLFAIALSIVYLYDATRVEKLLAFFTGSNSSFHGLSLSMMSFSNIGFLIVGLILLLIPNRFHTIPKGLRSFLKGVALTLVFLGGPWVSGDTAGRFALILILPAVIVGAYLIWMMRKWWIQSVILLIVLAATIIPTVNHVQRGVETVISTSAISEIESAKSLITDSENSIIVTRHGAEWWASWITGTDIAQTQALTTDIWSEYQHVYFLTITDTRGGPGGGGMMGGGTPPNMGSQNIWEQVLSWLGISGEHSTRMGRPPQMGSGTMIPPGGSDSGSMMPPTGSGSGPMGGGGGVFASATIPSESTIIYSGSAIQLAEVTLDEYTSSLSATTSGQTQQ